MAKIYLAARYSRRKELCVYRHDLLLMGHEVTSRWLEPNPEGEAAENRGTLTTEERADYADKDLTDLLQSDIVVSFTEPPRSGQSRGGRHVEFGFAMACGKRCVVIGHRENVFHCLVNVVFFETWEEAKRVLEASL